jgi:hypothetical protein
MSRYETTPEEMASDYLRKSNQHQADRIEGAERALEALKKRRNLHLDTLMQVLHDIRNPLNYLDEATGLKVLINLAQQRLAVLEA